MRSLKVLLPYTIFFLLFSILSLGQDLPEQDMLYGSEKFNNRGLLNSSGAASYGNEIIGEYDGNIMLKYDLSSKLYNDLSVNISLLYNSNVEHKVFCYELDESDPGGFPINIPEWIIGINGIAVQTFNFENNFYLSNGTTSSGFNDPLLGSETPTLIPGYHYTNRLESYSFALSKANKYRYDYIEILMADGSKKLLCSVNNTRDHTASMTGLFVEPNKLNIGYAIVDVISGSECRKMWYKPGDGLTYYFEEEEVNYIDETIRSNNGCFYAKIMYLKQIISPNGTNIKILYNNMAYGRKTISSIQYNNGLNSQTYSVGIFELSNASFSISIGDNKLSGDFTDTWSIGSTSKDMSHGKIKYISRLYDINNRTDSLDYLVTERDYKYQINYEPETFYFRYPINVLNNIKYFTKRETLFKYYNAYFDSTCSEVDFNTAINYNKRFFGMHGCNELSAYRDNRTNFMLKKRESFSSNDKVWEEDYKYTLENDLRPNSWGEKNTIEGIITTVTKKNYLADASSPDSIITRLNYYKYNIFEYDSIFQEYPNCNYVYSGSTVRLHERTKYANNNFTINRYYYDFYFCDICEFSRFGSWQLIKEESIDSSSDFRTQKDILYKYDFIPVHFGDRTRNLVIRKTVNLPNGVETITEYNSSFINADKFDINSIYNPTTALSERSCLIDSTGASELLSYTKHLYSLNMDVARGKLKQLITYDTQDTIRKHINEYDYYDSNDYNYGFPKEIDDGSKTIKLSYRNITQDTSIACKIVKYDGTAFNRTASIINSNSQFIDYILPLKTLTLFDQDTLSTFQYIDRSGNNKKLISVDENGYYHELIIDNLDRVTQENHPGSFLEPVVNELGYQVLDSYGSVKYVYYDDSNKVNITSNYNPSPSGMKSNIVTNKYDPYGNLIKTLVNGETKKEIGYNYLNLVSYEKDGLGRSKSYEYDYLNRPISTKNGVSNLKYKVDYFNKAGNLSMFENNLSYYSYELRTDEEDRKTYIYYDSLGNAIYKYQSYYQQPSATLSPVLTWYEGSRLKTVISKGEDWSTYENRIDYHYDGFGNINYKRSEDDGEKNFIYDKYKNLRYNSQTGSFYSYDKNSRMKCSGIYITNYSDFDPDISNSFESDTSKLTVINMYDKVKFDGIYSVFNNSGITTSLNIHNLKGRLSATAYRDKPGAGWNYKIYAYDYLGRVNHFKTKMCGDVWRQFDNSYDHQGNLTLQHIQSDGSPRDIAYMWYDYDTQGRLYETRYGLTDNKANAALEARYTYNSADQITSIYNPAYNRMNYQYDADNGWLTNIKHEPAASIATALLDEFDFNSIWWQPWESGSTQGIDNSQTLFEVTSEKYIQKINSRKLTYVFNSIENGTCRLYRPENLNVGDDPNTIFGMWIYGDGSRNRLDYWFTNNAGTFNPVNVGVIDWIGWKFKYINVSDIPGAGNNYLNSIVVRQLPGGTNSGVLYFDAARIENKDNYINGSIVGHSITSGTIAEFETYYEWWQPQESGSTTGIDSAATSYEPVSEPKKSGSHAGKLSYKFSGAANGVCRLYYPVNPSIGSDANQIIGMWVYGDGSRNILEYWFYDSSNNMVREFIDVIDWIGWKFKYIKLSQIDGGGAKKFHSVAIVQNPEGALSGTIYLDKVEKRALTNKLFEQELSYADNGNVSVQNFTNYALSPNSISFDYEYDGRNWLTVVLRNIFDIEEKFEYYHDGSIYKDYRKNRIHYLSAGSSKLSQIKNCTKNGVDTCSQYTYINFNREDYDERGNLIYNPVSGIRITEYDSRNLPLVIQKETSTYRYRYDDAGQRVYKDLGSSKELYIRDHTGREAAVIDKVTNRLKYINLSGNGLIGRVDVSWNPRTVTEYDPDTGEPYTYTVYDRVDNKYYYIKDHIGSIRVTVDKIGDIKSAQDYYVYGEIMRAYNSGLANDKYKITDKERDSETNYDYFGARYYDSSLPRWLSVDPMASKYPGMSPYVYCRNNPLKLVDPDGKFPIETHVKIEAQVFGNKLSSVGQNIACDILLFNQQSIHFDNYNSFSEINNVIEKAGGFNNLPNHSIGDFYSHTNYVDLWKETADYRSGKVMPTFQELNKNSEFGKSVQSGLKSTIWPDDGGERGHDNGTVFKSKDNPGSTDSEKENYNNAYNVTVRSLKIKKKFIETENYTVDMEDDKTIK